MYYSRSVVNAPSCERKTIYSLYCQPTYNKQKADIRYKRNNTKYVENLFSVLCMKIIWFLWILQSIMNIYNNSLYLNHSKNSQNNNYHR